MLWLLPPPLRHPFLPEDQGREAVIVTRGVARPSRAAAGATSLARPLRVASLAEALSALEEIAGTAARPLLFHRIGSVRNQPNGGEVHCVETVSADAAQWQLVFFILRASERDPATPLASPIARPRAVLGSATPDCVGTWHFCPDFPLDLKTGDGQRIAAELAPAAAACHWVRPEAQARRISSLLMDACDEPVAEPDTGERSL
jgi:hypothetical protein